METVSAPRVVVLMSTFNGERFVLEQLQSILQQLPQHGCVMIRDDGSRDGTVAAIAALNDERVRLQCGTNLGFGSSFLSLLTQAPSDADLVMFADQDDFWLPGKIDRAWSQLKALAGQPALYGSTQLLADAKLNPLHATPPWPRAPSLTNALCENIITGCTAAINRPALLLLQRAGVPKGVRFHDWWMYLVISAFGQVIFDNRPSLLYRQHGSNQIGHGAGLLGRYLGIVRFLLRHDWVGILLHQVAEFAHHYGDQLDPERRRLVLELFDIRDSEALPRWRLIVGRRLLRQRLPDEVAFRVMAAAYRLNVWPPNARRLRL